MGVFVNTWSVEGFVSEGLQPAELGWGTHEKWMPENGAHASAGCQAAIYLLQPGAGHAGALMDADRQAQRAFHGDAQRIDLASPITSRCATATR